jgi:hypothetical protein
MKEINVYLLKNDEKRERRRRRRADIRTNYWAVNR